MITTLWKLEEKAKHWLRTNRKVLVEFESEVRQAIVEIAISKSVEPEEIAFGSDEAIQMLVLNRAEQIERVREIRWLRS